ncbi:hypothetical protein ACT4S2_07635 [Kocuria turfanensis]|uniref:hypothetical protein n=1 Tax=Kocuria turfanensis TaxID=388357 RepID=UPI0040374C9C
MPNASRLMATTAAVLMATAVPLSAGAAVEDPAAEAWPPASTHGAFLPLPPVAYEPRTLPACDSELTLTAGDVREVEYRALVTEDGDTVVQYRGAATVDVTRASDGATLDELDVSGTGFETVSADTTTLTFDHDGPSLVIAFDEVEAAALAEAGLPEAFVHLDGTLTETVVFAGPTDEATEIPAVVSAEITENTTKYVFDLCDLLDQAAAPARPGA